MYKHIGFTLLQLALAALHRANEVHRVVDFERWSVFSHSRSIFFIFFVLGFDIFHANWPRSYFLPICRYLKNLLLHQSSFHAFEDLNENLNAIETLVCIDIFHLAKQAEGLSCNSILFQITLKCTRETNQLYCYAIHISSHAVLLILIAGRSI